MKRKLEKVIVIDVESTCEDRPDSFKYSEIIEIGYSLIDLPTKRVSSANHIFVRPTQSVISPFCTKLTGITYETVQNSPTIGEACDILSETIGQNIRKTIWASYGDYDRRQFERELRRKELEDKYPFSHTHINIKALTALKLNLSYEIGLEDALEEFNMTFDGTPHSGKDDAYNAALLFLKLIS